MESGLPLANYSKNAGIFCCPFGLWSTFDSIAVNVTVLRTS